MRTPEETIAKIIKEMDGKRQNCMEAAKSFALMALTGNQGDKEDNENDAKRRKQEADLWGEAIRVVEFWTTGPGREL
jgi:hypothetical protein